MRRKPDKGERIMQMNITTDSRKVKPGDIFVAVRCEVNDGHQYINKAIENGASKIIAEHGSYEVETEIVPDTRAYLVDYLDRHYKKYLDEMTVIGITGTNGKTTTAYLIYQLLNKLGMKTSYFGTIGYFLDQKIKNLPNTSVDVCDTYELILDAYHHGYHTVVMEVSSHALANHRLGKLMFDYTLFTNLTQDHLDFHKTMGNYALAKQLLFQRLKENGKAIVNGDDGYKDYYLLEQNHNVTFGLNKEDYVASNIHMTGRGTKFQLRTNAYVEEINTSLIGDYNVYNLLQAIATAIELGYSIDQIKEVVFSLRSPNGRMDTVAYKTNSIIIDYAHTPDAVKKILETMRGVNPNHLYVVFGCTGDRDRIKRPIMTKIVGDLADHMIITIDDPHDEDPMHVVTDMLEGFEKTNYEVELDRGKAIQKGIDLLTENDILMILGKGHEEVIIMKNECIPFQDKQEVEKYLNEKNS